MKTLIVSFVVLSFALFFGCQDSNPVVPGSSEFVGASELANSSAKDYFTFTYPNVIKLDELVEDPTDPLNRKVNVNGIFKYGIHKLAAITGDRDDADRLYKINTYVRAYLKGSSASATKPRFVEKTEEFTVDASLSDNSVFSFASIIRVQNTCCGPLFLVTKFETDLKVIKIVSMKLMKAHEISANPNTKL